MPQLLGYLNIDTCPHCYTDKPNLEKIFQFTSSTPEGSDKRDWGVYVCKRCGGACLAETLPSHSEIKKIYPEQSHVDYSVPDRPREYLSQAIRSKNAPAGAIMLAASAIDAMLKEKGYKDGDLYKRIKKAVDDHLITEEMGEWAHEVRLDANNQRHADGEAPLPTADEAEKAIEFASALGEFLFVLPSRVRRGRSSPGK